MAEIVSAERIHGSVKWFDPIKGYGFISVPGREKDVFVHKAQLREGEVLRERDEVEFTVQENRKGPSATAITLASR